MRADSGLRLTSPANPLLKEIRKAARRGRATADGLWLAESPHLLEEAADCNAAIEAIVLADRAAPPVLALAERSGAPLRLVSDAIFDELSTTEHSQGVLALVRPKTWQIRDLAMAQGPLLALDQVADPGNVGAIARSAEAFGAAGLLLTKGCAWPDNPKTLRASAGALFRLPVAAGLTAETVLAACAEAGRPLLAAAAHGGTPLHEAALAGAAIVIGSEAHGVSAALAGKAQPIHIPTRRVESLNAAVAAAIILYEAAR
ncbi:MAG: RNA methyltransferase [Bryobacterales bacterium]|nr:RNA methyltransferase [Acidobacteriota bacterium]MCB9383864.1 RNA methyltransferase [Bryobacterales bacterium]